MVIDNITLHKTKKRVKLTADITFKGGKTQKMYFSTGRKYEQFVKSDASAFLAAVLIPCMKTGENIIIHGTVSHKLLQNIWKIMNLLVSWNPDFHAIAILPDDSIRDYSTPHTVAMFFSAGVDSFTTYLKHRKFVNHFIFVNGFDIELENKSLFHKTVKNISEIAKKEKVNLITVETNVKNIIEPIYVWDWVHGGALGAVALFLRNDLRKLFIAGNVRKDQLFPYGTHPELDYLWGSEKLVIVHDGNEYSRLEKVVHHIAKSDLALSYLHVCSNNTNGVYNCSRCGKCTRTMMQLVAANALPKSKTFRHRIDLQFVRNRYREYAYNYQFDAEPVIEILRKEKREPELVEALKEGVKNSKKGSPLTAKIVKTLAHFDQEYNHRRFYTFVFSLNKTHDRNVLFKSLVNLGIIV